MTRPFERPTLTGTGNQSVHANMVAHLRGYITEHDCILYGSSQMKPNLSFDARSLPKDRQLVEWQLLEALLPNTSNLAWQIRDNKVVQIFGRGSLQVGGMIYVFNPPKRPEGIDSHREPMGPNQLISDIFVTWRTLRACIDRGTLILDERIAFPKLQ